MPDAGTVISGGTLLLQTLDLVHKRREGRLKKAEARHLYARIFASLLWEVHDNLERCKSMVQQAKARHVSAGVLSFFVRDALFADFCIMCPEPFVIGRLNGLYAAFERIHHWQRLTTSLQGEGVRYIVGYAQDIFEKHLHQTFNRLVGDVKKLSPSVQAPPTVEAPTP